MTRHMGRHCEIDGVMHGVDDSYRRLLCRLMAWVPHVDPSYAC